MGILEDRKKLPFTVVSSSVNTGVGATISSSFRAGVAIANLHGDSYGYFENEPAQGPFTETHVGGNQHRHVPLGDGTDDASTRPEAFLIDFSVADQLRVYGPDAPAGVVDTARPRASLLRGNSAKSPVNIRNHPTTTGSSVLGNYKEDYEIVQIHGRKINNRYLTRIGADAFLSGADKAFLFTGDDVVEYALPDRSISGSVNKFIFVSRFNAPGGPDVSSRGALDVESEELSIYNALPYRNLLVRQPLQEWLTQHAGPFGYSSIDSHTGSWYSSDPSASYHKINRNTLCRPDPHVGHPPGSPVYKDVYDNGYVTHAIPRTDIQYAWVTASAITTACELAGYQRSGSYGNRGNAYTDVEYNISSSGGEDFIGITGSNKEADVNVATHTWQTSGSLELWVNNGVYHYPTWKQIRTGEHPVARALKKNNIISVQDDPRQIEIETATQRRSFKGRRGKSFKNFVDPPVTVRFKPIEHQVMFKGAINPTLAYQIKSTHGNNLDTFANTQLIKRLNAVRNEPQAYDRISSFYLDPNLPEADNPIERFLGLTYKEVVFPREENTFLNETRGRDSYNEEAGTGVNGFDGIYGEQRTFWRDDNNLRSQDAFNSQGICEVDFFIGKPEEISNFNNIGFGSGARPDKSNSLRFISLFGWSVVGWLSDPASDVSENYIALYKQKDNLCGFEIEEIIDSNGSWNRGNYQATTTSAFSGSYIAFSANSGSDWDLGPWGVQVVKSSSLGWTNEAFLSGSGLYGGGPTGTGLSPYSDYDRFGNGVDLENNYLVANRPTVGVIIYKSSSVGGWQEDASILGTWNPPIINSNRVFLSDEDNDDVATNAGKLDIYQSGSSGWTLKQTLYGEQANNRFASNVAVGDGILVVLTPGKGQYEVFKLDLISDKWVKIGSIDKLNTTKYTKENLTCFDNIIITSDGSDNPMRAFKVVENNIVFLSKIKNGPAENQSSFNKHFLIVPYPLEDSLNTDPIREYGGRMQVIRRRPWDFTSGYFDSPLRRSLSHHPLKTNGILSFPESASYTEANGELLVDTDASMYDGDPVPSLAYVEGTNNFINNTSTDYVERLTENIRGRNPWYDCYTDYSEDIRRVGKDCSILPEFRISEHMDYYINENGANFLAQNKKYFSILGATLSSSSDFHGSVDYNVDFKNKSLMTDKLAHFDKMKNDHKDLAKTKRMRLRCKGVKKLLPYNGFYPSERTVQLGSILSQSVGEFLAGYSGSDDNPNYNYHGLQAFLKPLVSPGILYNSIKAGHAVDYPVYTSSAPSVNITGSNNVSEYILKDSPNFRLPFESIVNLTEHIPKNKAIRFVSTFVTASSDPIEFPYYFKWNGNKSSIYELGMHNFLAEVPNFFLAGGKFNSFSSAPEFQFEEMRANKKYYLDVVMRQTLDNNRWANYAGQGSLKLDRAKLLNPESNTFVWIAGVSVYENTLVTKEKDSTLGFTDPGATGSVWVYTRVPGTGWTLQQELAGNIDNGGRTSNLDGAGISIYENRIVAPRTGSSGESYKLDIYDRENETWTLTDTIELGDNYFPRDVEVSGNWIVVGVSTGSFDGVPYNDGLEVRAYLSSSPGGWSLDNTFATPTDHIDTSGFGGSANAASFGSWVSIDSNKIAISDPNTGSYFEIHEYNGASWSRVFSGSATGSIRTILGSPVTVEWDASPGGDDSGELQSIGKIALSGNYFAFIDLFGSDDGGTLSSGSIWIYKDGPSGWVVDAHLAVTGAGIPYQVVLPRDSNKLIVAGAKSSGPEPAIIFSSGSSGWVEEERLSNITGSFDIDIEGESSRLFRVISAHGNLIVYPEDPTQSVDPTVLYSFISQSSDCDIDNGWFPLYEESIGETNLRQNGRLFGMAMTMTGGNIQFNNDPNLYDPAYAAYTPPQFYGEAIARLSYTPSTTGKKTLDEIFEDISVESILDVNSGRVAKIGGVPMLPDNTSLAYLNKMSVSASVNLFGKFSEPDIEFSVLDRTRGALDGITDRFKPVAGTNAQDTNKNRWTIGMKWECPVLDFEPYDAQYSASYSSHVPSVESEFCNIDNLRLDLPRSVWTNYGDAPKNKEGVFFEIRDSFSPDEYDSVTGSLLKAVGFTPARKNVGRMPAKKDIHEAVVAIPYVERPIDGVTIKEPIDCNRFFFKIDEAQFEKQRDNLDKNGFALSANEADREIKSTTITRMIQGMRNFILPPRFDFENFDRQINDGAEPFVMYIFDFKSTLEQRDLIDIWHGVMPKQAIRMEKDEIIIEHDMEEYEFFHGRELPDNVKWMVFKIKQRGRKNYYEVTSDSTDDQRFRFTFQGDGQTEFTPDLNYNWPYDFYSLVELSKIEVEIDMENKNNDTKIENSNLNPETNSETSGAKNLRGSRLKGR